MSEHLPDSQIATNMTDTPANVVRVFPQRPAFVLELHSERMIDALYALNEAGFRVTYIKGSVNRYRIEDQEPQE